MTTHPIPNSFRLRRRKWIVRRLIHGPTTAHAGQCVPPPPKEIRLFDIANGRVRTGPEIQKTFWHESTHAILMTMDHKLARNEPFVIQFSLLLEELIRTARFEEQE